MRRPIRPARAVRVLTVTSVLAGAIGLLPSATAVAASDTTTATPCNPTLQTYPPQPGFNPLAPGLSDAQLQKNGFPPRPSDPTALAEWTKVVQSAKVFVPPNPICTNVLHTNNTSTNWAGYDMNNGIAGNRSLVQSYAAWVQPSVPANANYPPSSWASAPAASYWTGLGISYLMQSGCDSISTNPPQIKCWTEDYPNGTIYEGPAVSVGDEVFDYVWNNGDQTTTYYIYDLTNHQYMAFTNPSPYVGYRAANCINEKLGPYLPNFGYTYMWDCGTVDSSNNTYKLTGSNSDMYTMVNGSTGQQIDVVTSVDSNNGFWLDWLGTG